VGEDLRERYLHVPVDDGYVSLTQVAEATLALDLREFASGRTVGRNVGAYDAYRVSARVDTPRLLDDIVISEGGQEDDLRARIETFAETTELLLVRLAARR
jgi:hypothetical protein